MQLRRAMASRLVFDYQLAAVLIVLGCAESHQEQPQAERLTDAREQQFDHEEPVDDNGLPSMLNQRCTKCHALPDPSRLPRDGWRITLEGVVKVMRDNHIDLTGDEFEEVLAYFQQRSPEYLSKLPYVDRPCDWLFESEPIGRPAGPRPLIGNVNIVDLDKDQLPDVLVCDDAINMVTWIRSHNGALQERPLASVAAPGRTAVFDFDGDDDLDIVVASLGNLRPSDEEVGQVIVLINDGQQRFNPQVLAEGLPRVADVRPADFDLDGDIDFVVGMFGWRKTGALGWLEQKADGEFEMHRLISMCGSIHVPVADLNGDGRPDFVALFSQHIEQVVAFVNRGPGQFEPTTLFDAQDPVFGSSGIKLVDLDQDGDLDVLYTNGDAFDFYMCIRPHHGVQWLENLGDLEFKHHDIKRLYGIYDADAADLDNDGDLDIVAASFFNDWHDTKRQSLVWLENNGQQHFMSHALANTPTDLITVEVEDMDGDGREDIVAGASYMILSKEAFPERQGRLVMWKNRGPSPGDSQR